MYMPRFWFLARVWNHICDDVNGREISFTFLGMGYLVLVYLLGFIGHVACLDYQGLGGIFKQDGWMDGWTDSVYMMNTYIRPYPGEYLHITAVYQTNLIISPLLQHLNNDIRVEGAAHF